MKNEPNCALMEMAFRKGDIIMTKLRQLARYLVYSYENHTAARFGDNELKLQTMLYFAQRECLALVGEPLFDGNFENWAEGPVLPELHFFFVEGYDPFEPLEMKKLTEREQFILDRVVLSYGQYEGWYLADLTRRETSWRNSRSDPAAESAEPKLLEIADMREDAKKVRLYDPLFDVYLDEFEDFEGEVLKS
ncbi:Panacea domain-containing protein [Trichococcus flocculiformis]|uniref:Panacea domain-containing protein n=1 Tax=Trichococcus flocculiformis TaxID=82803 RepID=UPI002AAC064D|nr:type II toxin-antitoxin system antitoxin SocA domain-containing protein [Trichococcus flocculiformis]